MGRPFAKHKRYLSEATRERKDSATLGRASQTTAEFKPGKVAEYGVVRAGDEDEVMVDLMKTGCGVTYADAIADAVTFKADGVPIPFASPRTLWRM